jgi:hypothetical protein
VPAAAFANRRRTIVQVCAALAACLSTTSSTSGQPSRVTIPFLVSTGQAAALEFDGAECQIDAGDTAMTCAFQQVFLTTSSVTPDTCLVTTNRYERTFRRDAPGHWTSTEGPTGSCGLLDIATLEDGGGVRWTMELHKQVTKRDDPACGAVNEQPETFGWRDIRRPLPCRFVQPGGLIP